MKNQKAIEERLKETKDFYDGRHNTLTTGKVKGDLGFRQVVLGQMLSATAEMEILEWVLANGENTLSRFERSETVKELK